MSRRLAITGMMALTVLIMGGAASAEANAYLKIRGQKSGDVKGGVTLRGREGSIMVNAVSHSIVAPRDAASGLPTGKLQHKPLVITKEVDASSPVLHKIMATNEKITSFKLQFWRLGANGKEEQYFTIELVNASIASIDARMYDNKNPELASYAFREELAFTYEKITWTWIDGGIKYEDSWESPVARLERGAKREPAVAAIPKESRRRAA
jgi:type VI secretion system secreted protein Hcp